MKVLVTGDKGFVGLETVKSLDGNYIGYDVMDGFDIRDIEQLEAVVREERPTAILHLAAIARFTDSDRNPLLAFETNVLGTKNIVEVCAKRHIPLVYASTGSVYMPITRPPPITEDFECKGNSVYGCTKFMGEEYVRRHSPHIILRYAHLYGNEKRMHGLIGGFLDRIERGLAPMLYGGQQSNDFTYIKDVVQANLLALKSPWDKWNQTYNIGTGQEITSEDAGRLICDLSRYKGEMTIREGRTVDPSRFVYSIEKAKTMLGYEPKYNFHDGLKDMFEERSKKVNE